MSEYIDGWYVNCGEYNYEEKLASIRQQYRHNIRWDVRNHCYNQPCKNKPSVGLKHIAVSRLQDGVGYVSYGGVYPYCPECVGLGKIGDTRIDEPLSHEDFVVCSICKGQGPLGHGGCFKCQSGKVLDLSRFPRKGRKL